MLYIFVKVVLLMQIDTLIMRPHLGQSHHAVIEAMKQCMEEYGANPGRGSHKMAVRASRVLFETRK